MKPHVLVVEDEALAALALEDLLTFEGYRVTVAPDGNAALDAFRSDAPDAVITDLNMPRMNGAELMRRLRGLEASLPILVMTGYRALTPEVESLRERLPGSTPILEKPVDLDQVSHELRRVLARAEPAPT